MGKFFKNNATNHVADKFGKKTLCGLRIDTYTWLYTKEQFIQRMNEGGACCKKCQKKITELNINGMKRKKKKIKKEIGAWRKSPVTKKVKKAKKTPVKKSTKHIIGVVDDNLIRSAHIELQKCIDAITVLTKTKKSAKTSYDKGIYADMILSEKKRVQQLKKYLRKIYK